jgi:FtsZ-interacting cell division protein ZipA
MDQQLLLFLLVGTCAVAIVALLLRLWRERREQRDATRESPIAMSSEGQKLCPSCATANVWTDSRCVGCGRQLPADRPRAW